MLVVQRVMMGVCLCYVWSGKPLLSPCALYKTLISVCRYHLGTTIFSLSKMSL